MECLEIYLAWVLIRYENTLRTGGYFHEVKFGILALNFYRKLKKGDWVFRLNKFGNLCAAAHVVCVEHTEVPSVLHSGPEVIYHTDYLERPDDAICQLLLLDFWAEVGYGKSLMGRVRNFV